MISWWWLLVGVVGEDEAVGRTGSEVVAGIVMMLVADKGGDDSSGD